MTTKRKRVGSDSSDLQAKRPMSQATRPTGDATFKDDLVVEEKNVGTNTGTNANIAANLARPPTRRSQRLIKTKPNEASAAAESVAAKQQPRTHSAVAAQSRKDVQADDANEEESPTARNRPQNRSVTTALKTNSTTTTTSAAKDGDPLAAKQRPQTRSRSVTTAQQKTKPVDVDAAQGDKVDSAEAKEGARGRSGAVTSQEREAKTKTKKASTAVDGKKGTALINAPIPTRRATQAPRKKTETKPAAVDDGKGAVKVVTAQQQVAPAPAKSVLKSVLNPSRRTKTVTFALPDDTDGPADEGNSITFKKPGPASETIPAGEKETVAGTIYRFVRRHTEVHVFEFEFDISNLTPTQRFVWALRESDRLFVILRSKTAKPLARDIRDFCVHCHQDKVEKDMLCQDGHRFITVDNVPESESNAGGEQDMCSVRSTLLAFLLGRELRQELSRHGTKGLNEVGKSILDFVNTDPTTKCVVCGADMPVKVYRPSTCTAKCAATWDTQAPLSVRLSPWMADPNVLDFLLCCVYSASQAASAPNAEDSVAKNGPATRAPSVVDTFPPLAPSVSASDILSGPRWQDRRYLLEWMCKTFRGTLMALRGPGRVPGLPSDTLQFLFPNLEEQQMNFFLSKVPADKTTPAFHGTAGASAWKILTRGFRPNSWFAERAFYSKDYLKGELVPWKNSNLGLSSSTPSGLMFGISAMTPPLKYRSKSVRKPVWGTWCEIDGRMMLPRFVFLLPLNIDHATFQADFFSTTGKQQPSVEAMKRVEAGLRAGDISGLFEQKKDASAEAVVAGQNK